jgi:hypothetical protein
MLAADAIVLAISAPATVSGSAAVADVEVAVNPSDAGPVACNAANGIVSIAVLPNGGQGAGSPGSTPAAPGGTAPASPGTGAG